MRQRPIQPMGFIRRIAILDHVCQLACHAVKTLAIRDIASDFWWGEMNTNDSKTGLREQSVANIAYIQRMLAELLNVAQRERAHMLCYLIEMAYVEAGDLQKAVKCRSVEHGERH